MEGKEGEKKLIDKYKIPLNHLDFAYIGECKNVRELGKIVQILRSGEEGYFPDLTKCAEDKLRELKPNSRLFRYEEQLPGREALSNEVWKPVFDWTDKIKIRESAMLGVDEKVLADMGVPPVRKSATINRPDEKVERNTDQSNIDLSTASKTTNKANERIKLTDYKKWDNYDADEECLRMELAEERELEEVERKNRLNKKKSKQQAGPGKNKAAFDTAKEREMVNSLTEVERERLAEEYRLRGNDYFRAKEYEDAINEYNRSINMCSEKAAPAYNNRAAAKIKLKWYTDAIKDCEQCLEMEPDNVKARLRLADATYCDGARQESYALYMKVLDLEPANAVALRATAELKSMYGELPPPTATRLQIEEDCNPRIMTKDILSMKSKNSKKTEKQVPNTTRSLESLYSNPSSASKPLKTTPNNYDLSDLIKPNRLVKNKLATATAALTNMNVSKLQKPQKEQNHSVISPSNKPSPAFQSELKLPCDASKTNGKHLIQEI